MNKAGKAKALLSIILLVSLVMLVGCSNKTAETSQPAKVAKTEEPVVALANEDVVSTDSGITLQDEVNASKTVDLEGLTEDEKFYIENTLEKEGISVDDILAGTISLEEADRQQAEWIDTYILSGNLPSNGQEIFNEYKEKTGYYDQFTEEHHEKPVATEQQEEVAPKQTVPASSTNKPKPSEAQQIQQLENNQNKPENQWGGYSSEREMIIQTRGGREVSAEEFYEALNSGTNHGCREILSDGTSLYLLAN